MSRLFPVTELFSTWQGEGEHLGRACFFIRLYGCPVHCTFCDSAGTWHKDWTPSHIAKYHACTLAQAAAHSGAPFVVLTGGEPGMFDFSSIRDELARRHIKLHVETSGAFEMCCVVDWLTVSPKWAKLPHPDTLLAADEYKLIIEKPSDIEAWWEIIEEAYSNLPPRSVWLHPEWSQRENAAVLNAITDAVKAHPFRYRAGWQLHKLYKADLLDPGAQKELVPLGGNPEMGY